MFNSSALSERLKETFGNDTQETIAQKLNFSQSQISKLLHGRPPTVDTLYHIAKEYHVSVDWLLGLSDCREGLEEAVEKTASMTNGYEFTYSMAIHGIFQLYRHNVADISEGKEETVNITIKDPLMSFLTMRCINVFKADRDLLQEWFDKKLSLFDSKPVFYYHPWNTHRLFIATMDAQDEHDWLGSYNLAQKEEEEYSKLVDGQDSE